VRLARSDGSAAAKRLSQTQAEAGTSPYSMHDALVSDLRRIEVRGLLLGAGEDLMAEFQHLRLFSSRRFTVH
jgi:hypothetical protein